MKSFLFSGNVVPFSCFLFVCLDFMAVVPKTTQIGIIEIEALKSYLKQTYGESC